MMMMNCSRVRGENNFVNFTQGQNETERKNMMRKEDVTAYSSCVKIPTNTYSQFFYLSYSSKTIPK